MDSLTFVSFTQILHHGDALIDYVPDGLVCFDKIGVRGLGKVTNYFAEVLVTYPRIDALDAIS